MGQDRQTDPVGLYRGDVHDKFLAGERACSDSIPRCLWSVVPQGAVIPDGRRHSDLPERESLYAVLCRVEGVPDRTVVRHVHDGSLPQAL